MISAAQAPDALIARHELLGFRRTPGALSVEPQSGRTGRVLPGIQNRIQQTPCLLDFVAACEERGVSIEGVDEQSLIGIRQDSRLQMLQGNETPCRPTSFPEALLEL